MSRRTLVNLVLVPVMLLTLGVSLISAAPVGEEVRGSGPGFGSPFGIAVESDGSLVVVDPGLEALVRVDPVSGERTILSDDSTGPGPGFGSPRGIAVESDGSLVVVDDGLEALVRVDPVSGERTIVSDASTGRWTGL